MVEQAKRRRFTAEYKLRIVREADACKGDGDVAARKEPFCVERACTRRNYRVGVANVTRSPRWE